MPYKKEGAMGRCFDMSQDLNWHGRTKLWREFKQKFPQYKNLSNKELKDIMDNFFSYCAKVLVETENGILLDRLGYFALTVFDTPKKMVNHKRLKLIPNYKADGDVYRCMFYSVRQHHSVFHKWMFIINKGLKKTIKEKIEEGMKYRNHIKILEKNSKFIKSET